ncbi:hypothetical protein MG293_011024 [Ovis ammon polii]|uniref:Uncharacterized protein n=1 Tax=Ovis ammon polii TaxID=230172 RepID=A0AAD4U2R3_OVIAM|nr:hypothetical protein MG293_011024 [Ovis ammon polii]
MKTRKAPALLPRSPDSEFTVAEDCLDVFRPNHFSRPAFSKKPEERTFAAALNSRALALPAATCSAFSASSGARQKQRAESFPSRPLTRKVSSSRFSPGSSSPDTQLPLRLPASASRVEGSSLTQRGLNAQIFFKQPDDSLFRPADSLLCVTSSSARERSLIGVHQKIDPLFEAKPSLCDVISHPPPTPPTFGGAVLSRHVPALARATP